jgi:hypothetical protein
MKFSYFMSIIQLKNHLNYFRGKYCLVFKVSKFLKRKSITFFKKFLYQKCRIQQLDSENMHMTLNKFFKYLDFRFDPKHIDGNQFCP